MKRACNLILAFLVFVVPAATAQDPSGKSQPSKNLLTNSSFEEALTPDGLPQGWSRWGHEDKYRSNIVEGGHTGKSCLKIEGEGTRGVVFANGIGIDRNKRYVLSGWARFEGDKDARALILFHYFRDGKWLGLPDVVGVTSRQKGWQFVSKTDRADEVPDAATIWISCTLEGKGTAWFDDLELVAYDRKGLPEDFEARLGPSNLPAEFSVLQRRIGTWDTQTTTKPGVWVPAGAKSTGTETVEWILGKKFIQSKTKGQPGDTESISMVTYDIQNSVYRWWLFDSTGGFPRSEMTAQWDEGSKTLSYKGTGPSDLSLFGSHRFVSSDRIETQFVIRDKDGKILLESEGTATRHK
jgi:hypothetical protein